MKRYIQTISMFLLVFMTGCGKTFLDVKADQTQTVPKSISDYQALLDNTSIMNAFSSHVLALIGADEYYIADARYDAFPANVTYNYQKRAYTWNSQIFEGGEPSTDWSRGYVRVLQANIVLDGLNKLSPSASELTSFNNAKGSALFYRALAFYSMAQLFCKPYNGLTAGVDTGLPLRLEADVTLKTPQSKITETYNQMISDLNIAANLLPNLPSVGFRPSKAAVYALLCRIYLQEGDYTMALNNASQCLSITNNYNDLNTMDLTKSYVFPALGKGNPEVIFQCSTANVVPLTTSFINVASDLLASYASNDLRNQAYFYTSGGRIVFKGSYNGDSNMFTGLATDEVLLNRAESYARLGKTTEALTDLNKLAALRYVKSSFVPFTAGTPDDAISLILTERKKELIYRGIRWEDLRRLNTETKFAKTLTRTVKGTTYTLPPNDIRYVYPLPLEAIAAGGYTQNPR